MSDLALDVETEDLFFNGSDFELVEDLQEEVRQRLILRLRLQLREWFLDPDDGTDWLGRIFGNKNFVEVDAELTRVIGTTPGVLEISTPLSFKLDRKTRLLSVSFECRVETGTLSVNEDFPFVG